MPELPEVETIRVGLARHILRKKIVKVLVTKEKIVRGATTSFVTFLRGRSFADVRRHGKLLMLEISGSDQVLLVHLKMTGQLIYQDTKHMVAGGHQWPPVVASELPNKYTHVQIDFADGSQLFFNDLRQFGYMEVVSPKELEVRLSRMGVDPITQPLTWEYFLHVLGKRTTSIKAVLLNQALIAGVGNIYADEICFRAKVRPSRRVARLRVDEKKALFKEVRPMLAKAISYGGTTFRDYVDADGGKGNFTRLLKVYGRQGLKCKRCKEGVIKKIVVAGRGTHFCPVCQK